MRTTVNGLKTNWRKSGSGKVALLLHGWGDDQSTFDDLRRALDKKYTVISLDLPGFGKSGFPEDADWGLTDYAKFLKSFLNNTTKKQIYAIAGHSSGGAIAVRGLGQNLLSCQRLILLDSSGIQGYYKKRHRALRAVARAGKYVAYPLPKTVKNKLKKTAYSTIGSGALVPQEKQRTFKKIIEDDIQPDAANIDVPTLLIYGAQDQATPPFYGQVLHNLMPASALKVLPGEHFIHHDQPEKVNQIIKDFLS